MVFARGKYEQSKRSDRLFICAKENNELCDERSDSTGLDIFADATMSSEEHQCPITFRAARVSCEPKCELRRTQFVVMIISSIVVIAIRRDRLIVY